MDSMERLEAVETAIAETWKLLYDARRSDAHNRLELEASLEKQLVELEDERKAIRLHSTFEE